MSKLQFHKMEGAGNDFVVIDNRKIGRTLDELIALAPRLCDRKFGIGADGLLVLDRRTRQDVDYTMIYRNADGSDAGMCGNGARCLSMFAAHQGFSNDHSFNVHDKIYKALVHKSEHQVTITFPDVEQPVWKRVGHFQLSQVYTGTEHVVFFCSKKQLEDDKRLVETGKFLRNDHNFNPPGTNVNFLAEEEQENVLHLQTYEKGVEDLTLACGTGAIASAISAHFKQRAESGEFEYSLLVKGGILNVSFRYDEGSKTYQQVNLAGPANFVYEGSISI